jgi:CheY-like chemotaxis protein
MTSKDACMTNVSFVGQVIIFSRAEGSSAMMMRDLVRNAGGKFVEQTPSTQRLLEAIRRREADMILLDDDPKAPVGYVLRRLLRDPIALLTPTMALCSGNDPKEETAIERIGRPRVLTKPVTAERFKPVYRALVALWNTQHYRSIRQATGHILDKNLESGLRLLVHLNNQIQLQPLVAPALAGFYVSAQKPPTAEKVLLAALKSFPRDLGIILALSDLYLRFAMPENARKLLVSAKASFGNSPAIAPDLIRSYVALDQLGGAIIVAGELWAKNVLTDVLSPIFAKLLFAEGRIAEIGRYCKDKDLIETLTNAWNGPSKGEELNAAS